ncbi:hypothetical protein [Butyrivibrio proteoclasticus]|uniref:hypothetical protein n=1 Tax=Butyrivibrio proteoclasticus TaxID=43305 RepID=UPI000685F155|nr:hypothetical protein [Butyrivibrio proteoclasticus]
MKNSDVCILITGCMFPQKNINKLSLIDSEERKRQYLNSIEYYLLKTKYKKIVYCDNSSAKPFDNLYFLATQLSKEFEWISFQGNEEMVLSKGKGYGEGEIIDYALNHSKILARCDCFIKVTGRLVIDNIDWFLYLNKKYTYFDVHKQLIDTRCYLTNIRIFKERFMHVYERVDDNNKYYLEHVFFESYMKNNNLLRIIPFYLNIEGQSGSMGILYKKIGILIYYYSLKKLIKSIVKGVQK